MEQSDHNEEILHEAERTDVPTSALKVNAIRFKMLEGVVPKLTKEQQIRADLIRATLARKAARVRHSRNSH